MGEKTVRILGIAPYEGMMTALERAAETYPEIELEVWKGDMEEGAELVRACQQEHFDAIVSRGGTAKLIQGVTELPVVEIQLSMYDILRSIRLAQNYAEQYAIVGFPNITGIAYTLCDLLRYNVEICTVHSMNEASEILQVLYQKGYRLVICDMVTYTAAQKIGLTSFLLTSGAESVNTALENARDQGRVFRKLRRENIFLRQLIEYNGGSTIVLSQDGKLYFSRPDKPTEMLLQALRARIPDIPAHSQLRFYLQDNGNLDTISAHMIAIDHVEYCVFHRENAKIPMRSGKLGIRVLNKAVCEYLFNNSFYSISGAMGELEQQLGQIAFSRQPLLILGELGTGKEQIARSVYLRSRLNNNPFVVIDCSVMEEKSWDYLFSHHTSPLNNSGSTIYFQNLEDMPIERQTELLAAIRDTEMMRRQRLLFTCNCQDGEVPDVGCRFVENLGMLTLRLPTMRSRKDEISSLASLYLNRLNYELGKQISGFEPTAIAQLQQYDWPGNYTQFKHVLTELVTLEISTYIKSGLVAEVLAKERMLMRKKKGSSSSTSVEVEKRTLDEINHDIAIRTVAALGGNRSLAAKQLGISRTTLWRMLGKDGE